MGWLEILFWCWVGMTASILIGIIVRAISLIRYENASHINVSIPVSVVIAARNEAEHLPKLVESLMRQDHDDYEVIIILDRCSDDSLGLMKKLESQYSNLRTLLVDYLPDHFSPKKYALTLGIKGAKNECVLLTDADCLPKTDQWIRLMSNAFGESINFVLGYSPFYLSKGSLSAYARFETFLTGFRYLSSAIVGYPYMGVGRNLIVRRSFFLSIRGYNRYQHIQGGDDDLLIQHHATAQTTGVVFTHDAQTLSHALQNRRDYFYQKTRHYGVSKYYKRSSKISHSFSWLIQLAIWVSFTILAVALKPWYLPLAIFFGYLLIKGLTYWLIARRMDRGFVPAYYPILELVYLAVIPLLVLSARVTKKVKWK